MADEPDGKRQKGRANSKGNVEAIGQQNQSTERAAYPTISMMVTDEGRLRSRSHDEHMPPRPRGWSLDKITLNRPRAITVGSVAGQHRNLPKAQTTPSVSEGQIRTPKSEGKGSSMTDLRDEEDTEGETLTLQDVLRNRNYRAALEVWLNANHCYENLAFYNAVEIFKSQPKQASSLKKVKKQFKLEAMQIFETYINPGSPSQVNLSFPVVNNLKNLLSRKRIVDVDPTIFDPCQNEIEKLLEFDLLPRFFKSSEFTVEKALQWDREEPEEHSNSKLAKFFGRRKESVWEATQNVTTNNHVNPTNRQNGQAS